MTGPITEDDLAVLRLVHAALRRDLALFTAELDDTAHYPADLSRLRRAWANFARQLHDHHTAEDELIWPTLRHRAGAAAEPVLASMTAEHATIAPGHTRGGARNVRCHRRATPGCGPTGRTHAAARARRRAPHPRGSGGLPLVRHHLTGDDLDRAAAAARRKAGLSGAKTFLPWILDHAPAVDRRLVLHQLPLPLRWLLPRWERQRRAAQHAPPDEPLRLPDRSSVSAHAAERATESAHRASSAGKGSVAVVTERVDSSAPMPIPAHTYRTDDRSVEIELALGVEVIDAPERCAASWPRRVDLRDAATATRQARCEDVGSGGRVEFSHHDG